MKMLGLKIWFDTQMDPDPATLDNIRQLPFFDEIDEWDEHVRVAFWLPNPDLIPTVEQSLRQTLGVLL